MKQDLLQELFIYDEGSLYWRRESGRWGRNPAGTLAGTIRPDGRLDISINGRRYKAHRLIWIWHFGAIQGNMEIDHIDRDATNNRIENLRLVTRSQNCMNRREQSNNATGHRGISWCGSRQQYESYICIDGKKKNLGRFDTKEEAIAARQGAEVVLFGEYSPDYEVA